MDYMVEQSLTFRVVYCMFNLAIFGRVVGDTVLEYGGENRATGLFLGYPVLSYTAPDAERLFPRIFSLVPRYLTVQRSSLHFHLKRLQYSISVARVTTSS